MPRSSFTPNIIDIEASGLYGDSYPIEVGLAFADGQTYCSLIKPPQDWNHWDEQAEKIHGISQEALHQHGLSVSDVARQLNQRLRNLTVYTDGWVVDNPWIIKLFHSARVKQEFRVSDLQMILNEQQMEIWHDTKISIMNELNLTRHRASSDAKIILETYLKTKKIIQVESPKLTIMN